MRVNVYAEELTDRVELVEKTADTGITFFGIRFYLEGGPRLHRGVDDDESAVTFWVPWTSVDGHDFPLMGSIFKQALTALAEAKDRV